LAFSNANFDFFHRQTRQACNILNLLGVTISVISTTSVTTTTSTTNPEKIGFPFFPSNNLGRVWTS